MANQEQGSFLAGFTVGLFAGAAGYFLFGTDKGRKLKTELAKEWQTARHSMPERGSGMVNYSSVTEMIKSIGHAIKTAEKEGREKVDHRVAKTKKTASPTPVKKSTPKFKGV